MISGAYDQNCKQEANMAEMAEWVRKLMRLMMVVTGLPYRSRPEDDETITLFAKRDGWN
jgi:hypothetical protein